mmetsp:Transcript_46731/g.91239  ORF Transcript_46731/g.91239 Transcript_46731/m.91239 type:complete len:335 (+) Transcript_46731:5936-6940(+)
MLYLQPRVELEKEEFFVGLGVEVFDRAGVGVPHSLGQLHGGALHLFPHRGIGRDGWTFLHDLLVTALHGAVPSVERDGRAVLVGDELHLEVARFLRQPHDEDGRSGHLPCHLAVGVGHVLHPVHATDPLAAAPLGSLDHDGKPDLRRGLRRPRDRGHVSSRVVRGGQRARPPVVLALDAAPVPSDARDAGALRDDGAPDLVAEGPHGGGVRADELYGRGAAGEGVGKRRVLGGVAPPGPHGVAPVHPGELHHERHVGVVVVVRTAGHVYYGVGGADVFGVRAEVLGRGHDHERDEAGVAEHLVRPATDRADGLHRRDAVIGDQDLADAPFFRSA